MYIIICETDRQSRFHAWDRRLRAGALGWPWGMGWGGRREGGSRWGTHVQLWLIHVNVWQKPPQYCNVISLQLKYKKNLRGMGRTEETTLGELGVRFQTESKQNWLGIPATQKREKEKKGEQEGPQCWESPLYSLSPLIFLHQHASCQEHLYPPRIKAISSCPSLGCRGLKANTKQWVKRLLISGTWGGHTPSPFPLESLLGISSILVHAGPARWFPGNYHHLSQMEIIITFTEMPASLPCGASITHCWPGGDHTWFMFLDMQIRALVTMESTALKTASHGNSAEGPFRAFIHTRTQAPIHQGDWTIWRGRPPAGPPGPSWESPGLHTRSSATQLPPALQASSPRDARQTFPLSQAS